ncbi:MAG: endonuclease/exonuclease/phosphatase family protein [Bacilli bacterium]|nr:endonuclease/exonuclease/phosphatase family protein [Bacilli bacterium]
MKRKGLKIALISVASLFGLVVGFVGGVLIFASVTTLHVKDREAMEVSGSVDAKVDASKQIKMMTWNAGYGALDERQDCYWDGGKGVYGESKEVVEENLAAMKSKVAEFDPDIFFLQELDVDSKRSYHVDELASFAEAFKEDSYDHSFARNFKAGVVPLPLTQMTGKVDAGISTFSKFDITEAERIQLPIPFSWPMSLFNLKRCLLVNRMPIEGSDKELVTINLHLEAYDDGDGRAKQMAMLMDAMKAEVEKGNYVIAGGDFNQTFSTTDYAKYTNYGTWNCPVINAADYPSFSFRMDDSHPTCRTLLTPYANADKSAFTYYMIDGFIASDNIEINGIETIDLDFKNTDHNPVTISFNLK